MTIPLRRSLLFAGLLVWAGTVAYGFWWVRVYSMTPGPAANAPSQWPAGSVAIDQQRPNLVTVLHPECACSSATMVEIEALKRQFGESLAVIAIIDTSAYGVNSREARGLVKQIQGLSGVELRLDPDGREADRFGAKVSGQTYLFDREGHLLFEGGVTVARGHAGPNPGIESIRRVLNGQPGLHNTSVFGCILPRGGRS